MKKNTHKKLYSLLTLGALILYTGSIISIMTRQEATRKIESLQGQLHQLELQCVKGPRNSTVCKKRKALIAEISALRKTKNAPSQARRR